MTRVLLAFALPAVAMGAARCTDRPATARQDDLAPVFSIQELMEHIVDPLADNIFGAVAVDVSDQGVLTQAPTTDEDWAKVKQGAVILVEAANLLKMHPRRVAPPGVVVDPKERGPGAPELAPEQIQAKIDADPALWDRHVNELKTEAMKVLDVVKARDASKMFDAGTSLDRACENCHLEYWYPGDRKAVLEDAAKRATPAAPKTP